MTLTLDLPRSLNEEIVQEAQREGVSTPEYATRLLSFATAFLKENPSIPLQEAVPEKQERDQARLAHIRSIRGKYAHLGVTTEDLHREHRIDESRSKYPSWEAQ
ncbi:MAG: hypothetical protein M3Y13_04210 [Armatimonadota bacterium]|nr:hypothetical protein [Armatimonadota bacterium]